MILNESILLGFVENLVRGSTQQQPFCNNWSENGKALASSFCTSLQPDALYVILEGESFKIVSELTQVQPGFDLLTVMMKNAGALVESTPLIAQIQVINIPGNQSRLAPLDGISNAENTSEITISDKPRDTYEDIINLVSLAISPYFDYIAQTEAVDKSSGPFSIARKKFSELALSLRHLQHRIHVPDLLASIPQHIRYITSDSESSQDTRVVSDSELLNVLTTVVNKWIQQIQAVTHMSKVVSEETSIQDEVQFWAALETTLTSLREQTQHPEVRCVIEILNAAKRFQVTLAFQNNLGISELLEETKSYNELLKDLPLTDLTFAEDMTSQNFQSLDYLETTIVDLFNHLKKWKGLNSLSLPRMIALIELLLDEIARRLSRLLASMNLVGVVYDKFLFICSGSLSRLFQTIETNVKFMVNIIRELMRKRQDKFMVVKIELNLLSCIKRKIDELRALREKHEELLQALTSLDGAQDQIQTINLAYSKRIATSSPFDFSKQGRSLWEASEKLYRDTFTRVLDDMSAMINQQFEVSETFAEFVHLFDKLLGSSNSNMSEFLLLFIEDRHKLEILEAASAEIDNLLNVSYSVTEEQKGIHSQESLYSLQLWDLSFSTKEKFYIENLSKVLGENWRSYSTGSKIDSKLASHHQNMGMNGVLGSWIEKAILISNHPHRTSFVLRINKDHESDNGWKLIVDIDPGMYELIAQEENLLSLGIDLPPVLQAQLDRFTMMQSIIYPLMEHIDLLEALLFQVHEGTEYGVKFGFLCEQQKSKIFELIKVVLKISWSLITLETTLLEQNSVILQPIQVENSNLKQIDYLQENIQKFNAQLNVIHSIHDKLYNLHMPRLLSCSYTSEEITGAVSAIQEEVSSVMRGDFCNLHRFMETVNHDISTTVAQKCQFELDSISKILKGYEPSPTSSVGINPRSHVIVYENNYFLVVPLLELSKQYWVEHIGKTLELTAKVSPLYKCDITNQSNQVDSEKVLSAISRAMTSVEKAYQKACRYFLKWQLLQDLLSEENCIEDTRFASELLPSECLQMTKDILQLGDLIVDQNGSHKINTVMNISFLEVRSSVAKRFSKLRESVLHILLLRVQFMSRRCTDELIAAQKTLSSNVDFAGPSNSVLSAISEMYSIREKSQFWREIIESLSHCQLYLFRQSVPLKTDWIHVEQLESQLSNVASLLSRSLEKASSNFDSLKLKLKSEWSSLLEEWKKFNEDWNETKPISADLVPYAALMSIAKFTSRAKYLHTRKASLEKIAGYMETHLETKECLDLIEPEIEEMKYVWTAIQTLWDELETLKAQSWNKVHVRSIRKDLESIYSKSNDRPVAVRQYSAFSSLQSTIKEHLRKIPIMIDLKSDAMKGRHWEEIYILLGMSLKLGESLTVGDVLNINLQMNETIIRDVMERANGEQMVQESLQAIKDEWSHIVFETFNHANKCRLIKNWNTLFEQLTTNLGTLASIKHSLFHGQFERERDELENKLNDLDAALNTWVDVQRQWVYLDGVFGSNNEIQASLPLESSRFSNVSFEYLTLLKKVGSMNLVIDVLSVKGLLTTLKKLTDSLKRTTRGLTNFLDKQRERFPRFFFIGNEDLLELLGSGNDEVQINKHIKRMFPGISSISLDRETSQIVAVLSSQGEIFQLNSPVSLIKNRSLSHWLTVLDTEVKLTMSSKICEAVIKVEMILHCDMDLSVNQLVPLIQEVPHQALIVAFQIYFSSRVRSAFDTSDFEGCVRFYGHLMLILASLATSHNDVIFSSKLRCLIIETMHQKEVVENLRKADFARQVEIWNSEQVFNCFPDEEDPLKRIRVVQGRNEFIYGFEYLGVTERLANTPLVNDCFLALTQALAQKLGGSPFGPAGTGKTECVKALGQNLGRMVLVFCCDESFDFQSMGRILLGICKVGCWGCFDEFNRLDGNILSSLSTQIERIENSLQHADIVNVSDKEIIVNQETGIFVTMNPDYVGRNQLPENLKKLFRGFAMNHPDKERIADVLLTSHGFTCSHKISNIIIPFFDELQTTLSQQSHYDFGLRALKSILDRAGEIRKNPDTISESCNILEVEISDLLKALIQTIGPKLVREDNVLFEKLLSRHKLVCEDSLKHDTTFLAEFNALAASRELDATSAFSRKALQVFQSQTSHHGFMLVGLAGTGKSTLIDLVLETLGKLDGGLYHKFTIDSKVLTKENVYGTLDPITRDWSDGILTKILREILANMKGELDRRTWIVFDGDIDPEWAENLNSLLDDNKLLTLPNGERLELPDNVRIVFEVLNLDFATPATVSRCAMIWVDNSLFDSGSLWNRHIFLLKNTSDILPELEDWLLSSKKQNIVNGIADILSNMSLEPVIATIYDFASNLDHIMETGVHRMLTGLFVYLKTHITDLLKSSTLNFEVDDLKVFSLKALALSLVWAFAGDCSFADKERMREFMKNTAPFSNMELPANISQIRISYPDLGWASWISDVEHVDLEPHQVLDAGTIVPTVDTVMHESLIHGIINKHSPLILCGPPGSGKTMTFLKALRSSPNLEVVSMNFSKDTTPESLLSTLEQHCEYKTTSQGLELSPRVDGKWAVVFCDEINLPSVDKYGTQRVISFMRQLVELSGFWRPSDLSWVHVRNIQFVGACNDPNDPGRNRLTDRFMRHVTLVMVDYPGPQALSQIYSTFNRAALKLAPEIRPFADDLTRSMIEIYESTKLHLTSLKQSHYIYSPRELTRWCRGILETVMVVPYSQLANLIRLWYHEGLRLFYDRLVQPSEKRWCKELFWTTAARCFPNINLQATLNGPVLYSTWITGQYESVSEEILTDFVKERLRVFSEEEMECNLVLFPDLLDHALRIDRALRQHQGHMILVGPSTSGKTCLTRFVTWMNGMKLVQLRVHSEYSIAEFEASLREVLSSCAKGEQICFLIDESSILEASFIERMNSLLANSEIPGLFTGENLDALIKLCATEASARGHILDSAEEIYAWFTDQISANLHVVFTMSEVQSSNTPEINSSPALFNRCVLSWMGDWTNTSLKTIVGSLIGEVPLDESSFTPPSNYVPFLEEKVSSFRDIIVDVFVYLHRSCNQDNLLASPKQFLDFIELFKKIFMKEQQELEENHRHTNVGLDKLRGTVLEVSQMKKILSEKKVTLQVKDNEARKMLNQMIVDQNESERKREFSVATKAELEKQEAEIENRRMIVMNDLELAEPAVLEAQRGVQNIKKQHLTEMRSMSNPPAGIKLALESVCVLLGYQVSSWRDVQLVVRQDDFIAKIVSFNNEKQLRPELKSYMEKVYLSRPDYNFETIHRASKACGPLLQWVIAQIKYSEILVKIGPLREQVENLERYAMKSKAQLIAIGDMISELEQSIEKYKSEYSEVIREAEKIKTEMSDIELKVERSMKLIENLTKERQRWSQSTKGFQIDRKRVVGNSIIGAAFSTYCGHLSQNERLELIAKWKSCLETANIEFDKTLSPSSMLATNEERSSWKKSGLPEDSLFIENFAIKSKADIPLIIDPTGNILPVLENSLSRKLTKTSFLSETFTKTVEDALRFGGRIVILNVEHYNPIMDSILRKEVSHTGGRRVAQFGSKSLVLLEKFEMILYTRDFRIKIPSFLRSRTTLLNFTVTKSNLENRVLNVALEHFEPELNRKRVELEALQSEYKLRLLNLRKLLLSTLNDVSGTFLENDDVIHSLEGLESESSDINHKISTGEKLMKSVNESRVSFSGVAAHLKNIFDVIMRFAGENRFYNFSFEGFIEIFEKVLHQSKAKPDLENIIFDLYGVVLRLCSPTLRKVDRMLFKLILTISFHSIRFGESFKTCITKILDPKLKETNTKAITSLLGDLVDQRSADVNYDWDRFLSEAKSNKCFKVVVPMADQFFGIETPQNRYSAMEKFCSSLFGYVHSESFRLEEWIEQKRGPYIISTSENYDASFQIKEYAKASNSKLASIAMGSKEGINEAEEALNYALMKGSWVLLQNIQMSPSWVTHLKGKLQERPAHANFKLFMTCLLDAGRIPNELIGISSILTIERQPPWKSMLLDTFDSLLTEDASAPERHAYFLLSWYHTTIQEKLKYVPVSFHKSYDINESDLLAARFAIWKIFGRHRKSFTTGNDISWTEIAHYVGRIIYGGHISAEQDLRYCTELAHRTFHVDSHKPTFNLIANAITEESGARLSPPDASSISEYRAWINNLPEQVPLEWIGLDSEVSYEAREEEARSVCARVLKFLH